jgi:hypothetical protein
MLPNSLELERHPPAEIYAASAEKNLDSNCKPAEAPIDGLNAQLGLDAELVFCSVWETCFFPCWWRLG